MRVRHGFPAVPAFEVEQPAPPRADPAQSGAEIEGATSAEPTLTEVSETDAGDYTVVVSNDVDSVSSDPCHTDRDPSQVRGGVAEVLHYWLEQVFELMISWSLSWESNYPGDETSIEY